MLQLKNIVKDYGEGDSKVQALKGVSINFRANEFVSILGHSGCGKTTLLNIVGGLDQYTDGDLIIKGKTTKKYKDKDWDTYRNHSVGFVFQSYNLIMHQTVLQNVELALTLSGVSKSERRRRAKEVLEKVGLGSQIHKKPNQMSGGQMQRVAIASILVMQPEIMILDEPTSQLDPAGTEEVFKAVEKLVKAGKTILIVEQKIEKISAYCDKILLMHEGRSFITCIWSND